MAADQSSRVRLAEVIASLSLATDLGMGQPMEHALRRCLLAVRLGDALGLSDRDLMDVYYVSLVCSVGCTIKMKEYAAWFGDEIAAAAEASTLDPHEFIDGAIFLLRNVGRGEMPLRRVQKLTAALSRGPGEFQRSSAACYEICRSFGEMLGFDSSIQNALGQMHERWDGEGEPARLKGEERALPARIAQIAGDVEILYRLGGVDTATATVRRRAGKAYDPHLAELFCREAPKLLAGMEAESVWEMVLEVEPTPQRLLDEAQLDGVAQAMAHFADIKSPYTVNHSTGVSALAEAAATRLGLSASEVASVRRAGLLHDLGRVGVPVGIWDKQGPLTQADQERIRLHPYLTERVLARSGVLGSLGALAALHHERLDGSGYHRGLSAPSIPRLARILAAADFFHTKIEPRPHRPAVAPEAAAEEMRREVQAGRLDTEAANAILSVIGRPVASVRQFPAALTEREVEVLRLIARGRSIREMSDAIFVSPKTVDAHIQHIYAKIGVSTRVAATLFAMRHDLLADA